MKKPFSKKHTHFGRAARGRPGAAGCQNLRNYPAAARNYPGAAWNYPGAARNYPGAAGEVVAASAARTLPSHALGVRMMVVKLTPSNYVYIYVYPFSLKARCEVSRLPPAFFVPNDSFFSKTSRAVPRLPPGFFGPPKTSLFL